MRYFLEGLILAVGVGFVLFVIRPFVTSEFWGNFLVCLAVMGTAFGIHSVRWKYKKETT